MPTFKPHAPVYSATAVSCFDDSKSNTDVTRHDWFYSTKYHYAPHCEGYNFIGSDGTHGFMPKYDGPKICAILHIVLSSLAVVQVYPSVLVKATDQIAKSKQD